MKPLLNSDGRLHSSNREKNKRYGNGNGQIWAQIEKQEATPWQNGQHQENYGYHVPEESREEMGVEKPKRCIEDRN